MIILKINDNNDYNGDNLSETNAICYSSTGNAALKIGPGFVIYHTYSSFNHKISIFFN